MECIRVWWEEAKASINIFNISSNPTLTTSSTPYILKNKTMFKSYKKNYRGVI